MSLFACDVCHKRARGPLGAAYLALLRGETRFARRLRLCSGDLYGLLQNKAPFLSLVDTDDLDNYEQVCGSCGNSLVGSDNASAVFATVYEPGEERQDFFARLCKDCADLLLDSLKLTLR